MPNHAKNRKKLTRKLIEGLNPEVRRYSVVDTDQAGLVLHVHPTGRKTFYVRFKTAEGKDSGLALGDYPGLLPEKARDLAAEKRANVRINKADPAEERRQTRKEGVQRRERTLDALTELYLSHVQASGKKAASTLAKEHLHLTRNVLPRLGKLPVDKLRLEDIEKAQGDIKKSAAARSGGTGNSAANDCRKYLNLVMEFGRKRGWLTVNPVLDAEKFVERPRERVASDAELRALWNHWETQKRPATAPEAGDAGLLGRGWVSASALQFLTLTLQRGEEVASMTWEEVSFEDARWCLSQERKKERRQFIVPLSPQALAILEEAKAINGDQPGPFMGRKDKTIKRESLSQAFERACEALGIQDLTPHDLRRTGRTRMTDGERLGLDPHIAELVLAHKTGGKLQQVYDQNDYIPEKRRALNAWASYVQRVAAGEAGLVQEAQNVIPFAVSSKGS
ncbi:MAG: tyrosine-type recombinase/integrase [Oceanicaulis sp.]